MKIQTQRFMSRYGMNALTLAGHYKGIGLSKQEAWNEFIKDRNLKPEMNAKDFYKLVEQALPNPLIEIVEFEFEPTHYDNLKKIKCQIVELENGVFKLFWVDGSTGSNPPIHPPSPERFLPLTI